MWLVLSSDIMTASAQGHRVVVIEETVRWADELGRFHSYVYGV